MSPIARVSPESRMPVARPIAHEARHPPQEPDDYVVMTLISTDIVQSPWSQERAEVGGAGGVPVVVSGGGRCCQRCRQSGSARR
jgi:hypothetical protein